MYRRYKRSRLRAHSVLYWFFWLLFWGSLITAVVLSYWYPTTLSSSIVEPICENPLNASCIPKDLDNIHVTNLTTDGCTTINGDIKLHGDVICETPIWPSCIDISGQSCVTPIQESCLPTSVSNWNVTTQLISESTVLAGETTCPNGPLSAGCIPTDGVFDTITLNSGLTCNGGPISAECMPSNATFDTLTVNNLTVTDFTHINMEIVNKTQLDVNILNANTSTINKLTITESLECAPPATIDQGCLPNTPTSKLTCDVKLDNSCIDISGHGVCSSKIDKSCVSFDEEDLYEILNNNSAVSLDSTTIYLNNTLVTGPLTCSSAGLIDSQCVDIDISGETCSLPINESCIPDVLTLNTLNVGTLTCTSPIGNECLPANATFDQLVVNNITSTYFTYMNMEMVNQTHLTVEHLNATSSVINDLTITGSLVCTSPATIAESCLPDIPTSKLTCDISLNATCIDISGHGVCSESIDRSCYKVNKDDLYEIFNNHSALGIDDTTLYLNNTHITGPVTCESPDLISSTCVDISMTSCTIPINANCVDISGETCTSPIDVSCLPSGMGVAKDVQEAAVSTSEMMTSLTYVDVPGLSLITSNSGVGRYIIFVNMQMTQSTSNGMIYVIINVDGVDIALSERDEIRLESGNDDLITTQAFKTNIPTGKVIKVMWKKSGSGNISVSNRSLIIQQV